MTKEIKTIIMKKTIKESTRKKTTLVRPNCGFFGTAHEIRESVWYLQLATPSDLFHGHVSYTIFAVAHACKRMMVLTKRGSRCFFCQSDCRLRRESSDDQCLLYESLARSTLLRRRRRASAKLTTWNHVLFYTQRNGPLSARGKSFCENSFDAKRILFGIKCIPLEPKN